MFPENRACPLSGGMSFIGSRCQSGLVCFKIASVVAYQPNCGTRAGFGPGKQVTVTGLVRPCSIRFWLRFASNKPTQGANGAFFDFDPKRRPRRPWLKFGPGRKSALSDIAPQKGLGRRQTKQAADESEESKQTQTKKGNERQEETYLDFT